MTKIFMNDTPPPPRDSLDRRLWDRWELTESPLQGTNIGKQFGLKKKEHFGLIKPKSEVKPKSEEKIK